MTDDAPAVIPLRPRSSPAELAKALDRVRGTLRVITDDHEIPGTEETLEIGPARVLVLAWADIDGRSAAYPLRLGPALDRDTQRELITAIQGAVSEALTTHPWRKGTLTDRLIERNRQRLHHRQAAAERTKTEANERPWLCEHCGERFVTQRGAVQHERLCPGGRKGRHGHRWRGAQWMQTPHTFWCTCGAEVPFEGRSWKAAFARHADLAGDAS